MLTKWDDEDLFRAPSLYGDHMVPALASIAQRLHELGTILNVTPDEVARLFGGLIQDGVDNAILERIANALEHRGRRQPARKFRTNTDDEAAEIAGEL